MKDHLPKIGKPPYHGIGIFQEGWDEFIQIDGTRGRIEIYYPRWDKPMDFALKCRLYREKPRTWQEPAFAPVTVFELEFTAFAEACETGQDAGPGIRQSTRVDFWIDACYASARNHETVNFPPDLD